MLQVIDRYVFKECVLATLSVIVVLLVILLGNTLVHILGDIAENKLPSDALWQMLLISLVHYMVMLLPLSLYLGILLGMGRLYKDSEMTAMLACGVDIKRLYRPVIGLTVPLAILTAVLAFYWAPWAAVQKDTIRHQAEYESELSGLVAGQFNDSTDKKQTLFFERLSEQGLQMQQVFLHRLVDQERMVQLARTAILMRKNHQDPYILFTQGKTYSGQPGEVNYRMTEFAAYGVQIKQGPLPIMRSRISSQPSFDLIGSEDPKYRAELHWRMAVPMVCVLLALLALPLSYTSPRQGRFSKIGVGILIYIIYSNMLSLGRVWLERETVSSWLGLWWVHAILVAAIIIILMRQERYWIFGSRSLKRFRSGSSGPATGQP